MSRNLNRNTHLHGVVDAEAGGDAPAWRVDVQLDWLGRVLGCEEMKAGPGRVEIE